MGLDVGLEGLAKACTELVALRDHVPLRSEVERVDVSALQGAQRHRLATRCFDLRLAVHKHDRFLPHDIDLDGPCSAMTQKVRSTPCAPCLHCRDSRKPWATVTSSDNTQNTPLAPKAQSPQPGAEGFSLQLCGQYEIR